MRVHQILALVSIVQALFFGILFYNHLNKQLKVIFYFICLAVVTESSSLMIVSFINGTTIWMTHFYVMFEFFLWAMFFWYSMKPYIKRNLYWALVAIFEIYCILNMIFFQDIFTEYSTPRAVECILILALSIITFQRIMIESKIVNVIIEPIIWINTAVLLYFASSLFFHLLFNVLLIEDIEFLKKSGYLFMAANTVFYGILSFVFFLQKKKSLATQKQK